MFGDIGSNTIQQIMHTIRQSTTNLPNSQTNVPTCAKPTPIPHPKSTSHKQILERAGLNIPKLKIHSVPNCLTLIVHNALACVHRRQDKLRLLIRYLHDDEFIHRQK